MAKIESALCSFAYCSAACWKLDVEELERILTTARRVNATLDVTGLLLYRDGIFLQVLEGPWSTILDLASRIERDSRHTNFTRLWLDQIDRRVFGEWNMSFEILTVEDMSNIDSSITKLEASDDEFTLNAKENMKTFIAHVEITKRLLLSFRTVPTLPTTEPSTVDIEEIEELGDKLFSFAYVSVCHSPLSIEELDKLLCLCRRNNSALNITGVLLYRDGVCLQVLEGPAGAVKALAAKIQCDPRHHLFTPVWSEEKLTRDYEKWAMCFELLTVFDITESERSEEYPSLKSIDFGAKSEDLAAFLVKNLDVTKDLLRSFRSKKRGMQRAPVQAAVDGDDEGKRRRN